MSNFSGGYGVAIVCNGQVVETRQDGQVAIPFGVEYTVRLINKTAKRAVAYLYLDGQNVSGNGFVVNGNSTANIERPVDKAVNFRFASINSSVAAEHGKAGPDTDGSKGLVEVQWRTEKEVVIHEYTDYTNIPYKSSLHKRKGDYQLLAAPRSATVTSNLSGGVVGQCMLDNQLSSGVTVEGGYSSQTFKTVSFEIDYNVAVIVTTLKLMGYEHRHGIPADGTYFCPACRTKTVKKSDKYCRRCGEPF